MNVKCALLLLAACLSLAACAALPDVEPGVLTGGMAAFQDEVAERGSADRLALAVVDAGHVSTGSAGDVTLASLPAVKRDLLSFVEPTATCDLAYLSPDWVVATESVPPADPMAWSRADLSAIRRQFSEGPFLRADDFARGSPADLQRVRRNAEQFVANGEKPWTPTTSEHSRPAYGTLARDAAFYQWILPSASTLAKLRAYLTAQAADPLNDFSQRVCLRQMDGSVRDAYFNEANWLARYLMTYDMVRAKLPPAERLLIENYIRRQAYFMAAHIDWGVNFVFPKRAAGDYTARSSAASAPEAQRWATIQVDIAGDCGPSRPCRAQYPVYAYARADGSAGPRLSVLTQWYNNRKSIASLAVGAAGVLLGDSELTLRAERYFMEWLTYSVFPDGSEGEFIRNGNYGIPLQGVTYAASNVQGAALLADMLARQGDRSLLDFSTRDGLFGTASVGDQPAKSLALVISTRLDLATGRRDWYWHQPGREVQSPGPATSLGSATVGLNQGKIVADEFHTLGLLLVAQHFPSLPIRGFVLRDRKVTQLPWPGSSGRPVDSGAGSWTDVFNLYPSALLLRAP